MALINVCFQYFGFQILRSRPLSSIHVHSYIHNKGVVIETEAHQFENLFYYICNKHLQPAMCV